MSEESRDQARILLIRSMPIVIGIVVGILAVMYLAKPDFSHRVLTISNGSVLLDNVARLCQGDPTIDVTCNQTGPIEGLMSNER